MLSAMIARALATLMFLTLTVAPSMACCPDAPRPEAHAMSGGHDRHGAGGDVHWPLDVAKAACAAMAALPASSEERVAAPSVSASAVPSPAARSAEGLFPRPAAPPPRSA